MKTIVAVLVVFALSAFAASALASPPPIHDHATVLAAPDVPPCVANATVLAPVMNVAPSIGDVAPPSAVIATRYEGTVDTRPGRLTKHRPCNLDPPCTSTSSPTPATPLRE